MKRSCAVRYGRSKSMRYSVAYFPASQMQGSLYLIFLIQKASTSSSVKEAVNVISWAHQVALVDNPTQSDLVKQVLAGAKPTLAHKTTKKEPITPEILAQLVDKFAGKDADLGDLHVATWCLVGFMGFLRFKKLSALKSLTCKFFPTTWKSS